MKYIEFIILLSVLSVKSFNQCNELNKLRLGGSMDIGPFSYETFVINYEKKSNLDIDDKRKENLYEQIDLMKLNASYYIIERAGIDFYFKLQLIDFKVIYHDFIKLNNFSRVQYELDKCGKVTYWITYIYEPSDSIQYCFGIEFDSKGKRLSKHVFPEKDKNKFFDKIIPYCKALEIARSQKEVDIDPIYTIELAYKEDINSFCWLITQDFRPQLRKQTGVNTYKAVSGSYQINLLYLNANNGTFVKKDKQYGFITN